MSAYFPEEIIENILRRLPVKSLLRFMSVSKSWRSLISTPNFVQLHLKTSLDSPTQLRLLLHDALPVLVDVHSSNYSFMDIQYSNTNSIPKWFVLGSCNGLVCLLVDRVGFLVCDPSSRSQRAFTLPPPLRERTKLPMLAYGFGYNSRTEDYNVVVFKPFLFPGCEYNTPEFDVLSVKDGSWKTIGFPYTFLNFRYAVGTFYDGAIHWPAFRNVGGGVARVIVSLNLANGVVQEVDTPTYAAEPLLRHPYNLGAIKDSLRLLTDDAEKGGYVFVLREYA